MICSYLIHEGKYVNPQDAMDEFGKARSDDWKVHVLYFITYKPKSIHERKN